MTCQHCGAHAHNAYLCPDCTTELGSMLLELIAGPTHNGHPSPGLLEDLQDAATGRARFSEPAPHTGALADTGPRLNPAASKLATRIHAQMLRIAACLPVSDTIWRPPDTCKPADFIGPLRPNETRYIATYRPSTLELAIWLAGHTKAIANQISADQTFCQIHASIRRIRRLIDQPTPTRYAGLCDCGNRLLAHIDAPTTTCGNCGIIHDIDARQRQLLTEQVNAGAAFTREQFPVALSILGIPYYSLRSFQRWRKNGQLPIAGYSDTGEPLYRLADVPKLRA